MYYNVGKLCKSDIICRFILILCIVLISFCESEASDSHEECRDAFSNFKLVGTVICEEPVACFEDVKSDKLVICRIGDRIGQAYKVAEINRGEVILESESDKGVLTLWTGAVDMYEPSCLSSLVSIKPEVDTETGDFLGLKLEKIKQKRIIEMAGIKEGDLINNINGQELSSLQKTVQVIRKAKKLSNLKIRLLRDNESIILKYGGEK